MTTAVLIADTVKTVACIAALAFCVWAVTR